MDSFTKNQSTTSAVAHSQSGPNREKAIWDAEQALKQKDRRISELEKELTLINVRSNRRKSPQ